jgi:hypothetical protein
VEGSTLKQRKEVWVRGVAYAPALHVRKFDKVEQRKGYLFHTDFQDADGDTSLFGKCPEVVRFENCTAWRPMSFVLDIIPRVVHPNDIKTRVIHVAGQEGHYVCGVSGIEKDGTFTLQKIPRKSFYMYPEEALGLLVGVQSATIMWEYVESLFENIRQLVRNSGKARSGSFFSHRENINVTLVVRACCWHDIVYVFHVNFGFWKERTSILMSYPCL